jgi:hypothetical protein
LTGGFAAVPDALGALLDGFDGGLEELDACMATGTGAGLGVLASTLLDSNLVNISFQATL